MDADIRLVQERIHHRFRQVKHVAQALTHSSWANEHGQAGDDNERLEFLGDAVLDLVISQEALARYPEAPEGQLTRLRSALVKERTLAGLALDLELDKHVRLGKGEEAQGGRERTALLADVLEAVIAAVFLDGGYGAAERMVLLLYEPLWPATAEGPMSKDHKSRLQETTQQLYGDRPVYAFKDASGPEHDKVFTVEVALPDGRTFRAQGPSLKKAEQAAARAAVRELAAPPVTEREKPGE